jgi:hypothetical protein
MDIFKFYITGVFRLIQNDPESIRRPADRIRLVHHARPLGSAFGAVMRAALKMPTNRYHCPKYLFLHLLWSHHRSQLLSQSSLETPLLELKKKKEQNYNPIKLSSTWNRFESRL